MCVQVVETADVILEVLDARDPLGSRAQAVEAAVLAKAGKKLVLVLNKVSEVGWGGVGWGGCRACGPGGEVVRGVMVAAFMIHPVIFLCLLRWGERAVRGGMSGAVLASCPSYPARQDAGGAAGSAGFAVSVCLSADVCPSSVLCLSLPFH